MGIKIIINLIKNKRILIIGPFPNPISGVSLANNVVKESLEDSKEFNVQYLNTSYPIFEDKVGSFSINKFIFFFKVNFKFFKIFRSDIVYITPGQTFYGVLKYGVFILISSIFKKELIIHVHGNYLHKQYKELKKIKKHIFHFLISRFNKGIVLSESLKPNLTPFIKKDKIFVLYNFAEEYLSLDSIEKEKHNLNICYLSNLMEEKGINFLLDALTELENSNIPYKARIAGNIDVQIRESILTKINSLKNTTYLGVIKGEKKKNLLNWSNIFILPTFYKMEGQPISIIEALATGNVIITTNHAGIPDIIEHKVNGYLTKTKDNLDIVKAINYFYENKNRIIEIGNYNKMYFAKKFTLQKFKTEIINIINS